MTEEPMLTLRPRPPLERLVAELRTIRAELVAPGPERPRNAPSWRALADRYAQLLLTAGEMLEVQPPAPPDYYPQMPAAERDHARWRLPNTEWEPFEQRLAQAGLHVAEAT